MKKLIAVIFSHQVMTEEVTYMEVTEQEYHQLVTAKKDQRFIELEGSYHHLDHIVTFWETKHMPDIGG